MAQQEPNNGRAITNAAGTFAHAAKEAFVSYNNQTSIFMAMWVALNDNTYQQVRDIIATRRRPCFKLEEDPLASSQRNPAFSDSLNSYGSVHMRSITSSSGTDTTPTGATAVSGIAQRTGGLICLAHNNRIYAFHRPTLPVETNTSYVEQNLLMNMTVTTKYRVLQGIDFFFHLGSNVSLLLIVIISIHNGGLMDVEKGLNSSTVFYLTVFLEAFYDIILFTNKFWFLQRFSIYIGMALFAAYYGTAIWANATGAFDPPLTITTAAPTTKPKPQVTFGDIISLLSVRLALFFTETVMDIFLDAELHNDLCRLDVMARASAAEDDRNQQKPASSQIPTNPAKLRKTENQTRNNDQVVVNIETDTNLDNPTGSTDQSTNNNDAVSNNANNNAEATGCCAKLRNWLWSNLTDLDQNVQMPQGVTYVGSLFAWGPYSVYGSPKTVWRGECFYVVGEKCSCSICTDYRTNKCCIGQCCGSCMCNRCNRRGLESVLACLWTIPWSVRIVLTFFMLLFLGLLFLVGAIVGFVVLMSPLLVLFVISVVLSSIGWCCTGHFELCNFWHELFDNVKMTLREVLTKM